MNLSYKETPENGNRFRQEYLDSIHRLIASEQQKANDTRYDYIKNVFHRPEEHRTALKNMLGWPLTKPSVSEIPNAEKIFIASENGISIYRLQIEVFEQFFFYGLLFVRESSTPLPLVIAQHGGLGTPELCSSFLQDGSANYNEMTMRILDYNVNVFAPQLLLWSNEIYGIEYHRHSIDAQLKQLGGSITALEVACIMRSIDYLQTQPFVIPENISMIGLSYGGFYTLMATAIDTRIKAALSYCFFNDRLQYSWVDWTWFNAANQLLDSEIALLIHPRSLYISVGKEDQLFDSKASIKEYDRLKMLCNELNIKNWVEYSVFEGNHEFDKDNTVLNKFMQDVIQSD